MTDKEIIQMWHEGYIEVVGNIYENKKLLNT